MYHSITIGDKNTWDDWHLIPTSRPLFNPPPVKTNYINIPGGDGVLDLSTALSGRPVYGNRTGSWEFRVIRPEEVYSITEYKRWTVIYSEIMAYLHGQQLEAILEDDPAYYYTGRFSVNEWKSNAHFSTIVIDYNVDPYKRDVSGSGDRWLWDPFNFETDFIKSYKRLTVRGTLTVNYIGDMVETTPIITCSAAGMKLTFNGKTYNLSRGSNNLKNVQFEQGNNILVFTGNGTVSIESIGGRL